MTLDKLFYTMYVDERTDNPFHTLEIDEQHDKLYNMFVKPIKDYDTAFEADNEISDFMLMVMKQAFKIGLKTAVDIAFISHS